MNYTISMLKNELIPTFNLLELEKPRNPILVMEQNFNDFPTTRVNSYLIKSNDDEDYYFGEIKSTEIKDYVQEISLFCKINKIKTDDRYCYITIDQGFVENGRTLRNPGFHIDGMQGEEVAQKTNPDFQFIWSDCLPTIFSSQEYDMKNINPKIHNIFNHLENQTADKTLSLTKPNHLYLMNAYHVHKASEAKNNVNRKFIRISYTKTPITSIKMTINEEMRYNYRYHTTTGEIPSHLK